ncbi:MAG: HNH endonuclease [Anaerolineales bacterium]|nr:MAG: HNH endonuclease [Anaerolineales bacterium]
MPDFIMTANNALGRIAIIATGTGAQSWASLRRTVFERDGGRCQVCKKPLEWGGNYECGHMVDRVAGGKDEAENLVAMCYFCNRTKPVHDTREDYQAWASSGGSFTEILNRVMEQTNA